MKINWPYLFSTASLLLVASLCLAQSNYRFHHYDTRDGLASEKVDLIIQDSLGFVWISYPGGISRFDGYEFKVYQYDPGDSLKSYTRDLFLFLDASGTLWGVEETYIRDDSEEVILIRYDRSLDGFVQYKPDIKTTPTERFNDIEFDPDRETIWITTVGRGLHKFNYKTGNVSHFVNPQGDSATQFANNWLRSPFMRDSVIVLPSRNGLWIFNKKTEQFSRPDCTPADSTILYHENIGRGSRACHTTNNIWFNLGDFDSWVLVSPDFKIIDRLSFKHSLAESAVSYLDHQDNFWFATRGNGLVKYEPATHKWSQIKSDKEDPYSLRTNRLTTAMVDRDQNIWVGTEEEGVSVLRKQNLEFYNYKIGGIGRTVLYYENGVDRIVVSRTNAYSQTQESEILTAHIPNQKPGAINWEKVNLQNPIKGIVNDIVKGKNQLWISSNDGVTGLPLDKRSGKILPTPVLKIQADPSNPNTIGSNNVKRIHEDEKANLWITAWENGLFKIYNPLEYGKEGSITSFRSLKEDPHSISSDFPTFVEPLDTSALVVGYFGIQGFDLFSNNRFEPFFHQSLPLCFYKSARGLVYVGTTDGLYVSDNTSSPYQFRKDPLISKSVKKITEDKLGRLWMSNLEGVICYDPKEKTVLFFDKREGIDHTNDVIYKSSNGEFVTANTEGISIFDPLSLVIDRKIILPVLTSLKVNNKTPAIEGYPGKTDKFKIKSDISVLDELTLDYQHNNFSVQFSAMEMTAPEKNLYRHMLESYDKDWIETDWRTRTATYTNLPAGNYVFRVKASNHHGVWSDQERTLKVIILPPPWRTWWAYSGYGLIILGLLYWARSNIVKQERLHANLQLAKVEQEREHFELEKAKEVDKIKTSFFTNISHEFRTPLTLIKGPVQNIIDQFINSQQEIDKKKIVDQLKLVQRNSDHLLKLINQLLDLAKLESGTMKIEKSKGDINSFINAIASSFHSFAEQKKVSIIIDLPPDHYQALFDKDKLETILINLINNAIKFTPSGGTVSVFAEISNQQLTLRVKDTGIGIPAEQQSKIFERFHQVSEAHKEVGTGVGLALVKEIVTLLGGTITLESKPGEGSEFMITIPIDEVKELTVISESTNSNNVSVSESEPVSLRPSKTDTTEASSKSGFENLSLTNPESATHEDQSKPHVLVVEDNNDLRAFIIDCLGEEFFFLEAENGKSGLAIATEEIPDMIISDVMMPEMDGITMAEKIKKDIRTSHIPLILLTAKSTEDSKLQGLQSGADDYLTKPFNKQELLLKVRNGVNRQLKLREKLRADLMSTTPKVEVLSADEQFLSNVKEGILKRLSDEQLSVESLAEDIGMSRVQLYRKVTGLTSMSVNELIRKLRLQRAAQLLQQKWGPVSQVAYEVGFSNLSYFSKVFREEFGVLPSDYHTPK